MSTLEAASKRLAEALQSDIALALSGRSLKKKQVRFLLGTDEDIEQERRVALTPRHMARLKQNLEDSGIEPLLYFVTGAGREAGFGDEDYIDAGAEKVLKVREGRPPLDVMHGLKEPTAFEADMPGPFLRLGALHLASKPPGVGQMLAQRNYGGIIDGGTVGYCSYLRTGSDKTPIVGSMSRFAGYVAGEKLMEGLDAEGLRGRVIVIGGGIAGMSAIRRLDPSKVDLVVVDPFPAAQKRLTRDLPKEGFSSFQLEDGLNDTLMEGAVGVLFAHRSGATAAEKVCSFRQISLMAPGAAVVDIAIDQGGSIRHADYDETDDVATSLTKYRRLLADYFYYAETNMPREKPHEASRMHGDSSLPYVTLLLGLCAIHGGGEEATRRILRFPVRTYGAEENLPQEMDLLDCLQQDLRNGLQLAVLDGENAIVHPDIEANPPLVDWIRQSSQA